MREKAEQLVQRYGQVFKDCFESGFRHWLERHRDELSIHRGRTRSCCVWDYVIDQLRTAFAADRRFRFIDTRDTTYIAYEQSFLIKVKKLDRCLRTSNVPTGTSEKFNHQLPLGFDGEWTHLYLGYIPDDLNMKVEQVHLTCPNGSRVAWSIPILGDLASQGALQFPAADHAMVPPRKRIRPKTVKRRSAAGDGS